VLALASVVIAFFGAESIAMVLAAVLLVDVAIQGVLLMNQTRLFSVDPSARSRLNTAFVGCNFACATAGTTRQHQAEQLLSRCTLLELASAALPSV
jgi:hypothetical protein